METTNIPQQMYKTKQSVKNSGKTVLYVKHTMELLPMHHGCGPETSSHRENTKCISMILEQNIVY